MLTLIHRQLTMVMAIRKVKVNIEGLKLKARK